MSKEASDSILSKVVKTIEDGGICIIPTDTIYGLVCHAENTKAIQELFKIKDRDHTQVFAHIMSETIALKMIQNSCISETHSHINNTDLYKVLTTGATILIPINKIEQSINIKQFSSSQKSNKNIVGIRVPQNKFCIDLMKNLCFPLVATSANTSNKPPPVSYDEIEKRITSNVNISINGDKQVLGLESTIISLETKNPKIIREGLQDLKWFIEKYNHKTKH